MPAWDTCWPLAPGLCPLRSHQCKGRGGPSRQCVSFSISPRSTSPTAHPVEGTAGELEERPPSAAEKYNIGYCSGGEALVQGKYRFAAPGRQVTKTPKACPPVVTRTPSNDSPLY